MNNTIIMELHIERVNKAVPLPVKKHKNDAAFDLYAAEDVSFKPFEVKKVPTGLKIAIPEGHVGIIRDRSGMAFSTPLMTKAGIIDCGFSGEWQVIMVNVSSEAYSIQKQTRIAQFLVVPLANAHIYEVEKITSNTSRGEGGFGSTGLH